MADGIGVQVWRYYIDGCWRENPWSYPDKGVPYLAIPLDAESLAGLRERMIALKLSQFSIRGEGCERIGAYSNSEIVTDAVIRALGLEAVIDP